MPRSPPPSENIELQTWTNGHGSISDAMHPVPNDWLFDYHQNV